MNGTLGQRAADLAAKHIGSWAFLIAFNIFVTSWCVVNALLGGRAFDPYPFILLNLVFSWLAGVQAPVIMISQNRQEEVGRETQLAILRLLQAQQHVIQQQGEHIGATNDLLGQVEKALANIEKLAKSQGVMLEQILEEVEDESDAA
ncbi:DUF1003 domain-containing protein [Trinickia sp. NRRL B-1857]|uniref:DUF1003 domain-containing protein n=1 Tax=Trinickia sp. NRRL B-1857 TaxID=3162879 RepID=UPI003D2CE69D